MKLPRDLSGEELVKHLSKRWDYVKIHQVGSHNPRSQGRDLGHPKQEEGQPDHRTTLMGAPSCKGSPLVVPVAT